MTQRTYDALDTLISGFDRALAAVFPGAAGPLRENPAAGLPEASLTRRERRRAAALMRVNHAGEAAAQGLYSGQALAARAAATRAALLQAAAEESDHLRWCEERLAELAGRASYLSPAWRLGSFAIGVLAGLPGDRWSLGFVAETERQVAAHLEGHLRRLPPRDGRSRRILERLREDELRHGAGAQAAGAAPLPAPVKLLMRCCAKVMTTTAYRL